VTAIAYPYLRGGEVINCKYRDKDKNFRMATGAERLLYGYDDISSTTVIVEGEMDKLAVEVAGIRACVSCPMALRRRTRRTSSRSSITWNDERLQKVERWVIAVDNDAPGQFLQHELVRRFGAEKCLIANWPDGCKDANDVLMQFGADTLRECIEKAEPVPIVGVFGGERLRRRIPAHVRRGRAQRPVHRLGVRGPQLADPGRAARRCDRHSGPRKVGVG
jgi:twinkle protein